MFIFLDAEFKHRVRPVRKLIEKRINGIERCPRCHIVRDEVQRSLTRKVQALGNNEAGNLGRAGGLDGARGHLLRPRVVFGAFCHAENGQSGRRRNGGERLVQKAEQVVRNISLKFSFLDLFGGPGRLFPFLGLFGAWGLLGEWVNAPMDAGARTVAFGMLATLGAALANASTTIRSFDGFCVFDVLFRAGPTRDGRIALGAFAATTALFGVVRRCGIASYAGWGGFGGVKHDYGSVWI